MNTRLPDYDGNSIVNLMQSIATACGSTEARYPQLAALPAAQLVAARHIVLLVIDGLGQRTFASHPACPNLQRHAIGTMTSVFPSTTASAITTFMTGLAPAQHGLTGWHMHLEEIGQTLSILPLDAALRGAGNTAGRVATAPLRIPFAVPATRPRVLGAGAQKHRRQPIQRLAFTRREKHCLRDDT